MRSSILSTRVFRCTAEIRKHDFPGRGYSFCVASTWPGAEDPTAEQTTPVALLVQLLDIGAEAHVSTG